MEKDELDFSNDLADLIGTASPTPDELSRLAARCGIERGSLEGKATEVRIELLVQSALRDPVLVDRFYRALPIVFPHLNRQELERLFFSRPPSLRSRAEAGVITREAGSASRTGSRADTLADVDVQAAARLIGHVFISYVREDSIEVDRLQRLLESAGVRVWRDTADLWPGEDWRVKIRQAISDNALVFLACFSRRSLARRRSYQNEELILAIDQMRRRPPGEPWLIPVRFDECDIPDLEIGGGRSLTDIQHADLFGDGFDDAAARLNAAVLRILGRYVGDS
jgi:TIR domain-containing protein